MGRLVKCPYCEEKLDKDEAHPHNKRYYHQKCFDTWQKESEDYKELLAYISGLYRGEFNTMLIKKQIKEFKEEGYKYKGMELALRYFFDTLGNRMQDDKGIGIIPWVYVDAKQHYIKQMNIAKSINNLDNDNEVIVHINTNKTKRKNKKIDITSI